MDTRDINAPGSTQYLTFDLAGERYAVKVASVEVVLEMAAVTRVPKSLPHIRGVINHRGSVVPVMDLRVVFGLEPTELSSGCSVIVAQVQYDGEDLTAGILADAVQEVIELEGRFIEPPPQFGSRVDGKFVQGIGKRGSEFVILLDLESAMAATAAQNGNRVAKDRM